MIQTEPATRRTAARLPGPDEATRIRQAARAGTSAQILEMLASDPAVTVRTAVALNPTFAPEADIRLLHDADERVRAVLAGKLAQLLPGLNAPDRATAQAHVDRMLLALADDVALRVRVTLTEVVAHLPEAPRTLILKLAHDPAPVVSDPVLRLSPLLTDDDLLELLAIPPHPSSAQTVASRPGLGMRVTDDIATHGSSSTVLALLGNTSATIREATLDALIGRAADHPEWHEPLVHRPTLPERAARKLARLVASHLLAALANRADLPPAVAAELRAHTAQSLSDPVPPSDAEFLAAAHRLEAEGTLNEATLLEAASAGDHRMATAILAVASGVDPSIIDRAVTLRSAKGLVSLVHRARFTMRAAATVQALLGRLGPTETLAPTASGDFPLTAAEIDWQIELLGEPGH